MNTALQPIFKTLQSGEKLTADVMAQAMAIIMDGEATDSQIGAFLAMLSMRGETAEELTGAAQILRQKAHTISAPDLAMDCCGTGGDGQHTYNISTAVSFVLSACGVPVAKHGNRAASSKSGAADVLEALGLDLDMPNDKVERALIDLGICFLMAPKHHSAMKHVVPVRKSLGFRTLFNLIGPLANPAGTQRQLIGVFDRKWLIPMAQTLHNLGCDKAWVVCGADGMDELTTTTQTYVAALDNGAIKEFTVTPEDAGLPYCVSSDLKGGSPQENAQALKDLLNGKKNAYRDIVVLNTAAALVIADKTPDLKAGAVLAAEAIDGGHSLQKLNDLTSY